eukprot:scaffold745_cov54-Phaeocystis_antarctica.AAC.5
MKQYLNAGLHPSAIVSSILGWRKAMGDKKALSRIFANCLEEQSANGTHQGWNPNPNPGPNPSRSRSRSRSPSPDPDQARTKAGASSRSAAST